MPSVQSVVFLNDHCHVQGGASRIAIDEAVSVAELGIDVTFLGATGPIGPELAASRVKTICLQQPELASAAANPSVVLQGLWNATAGRRTQSLLTGLDPARTVVHLHGFTKSLTTSPLRAATRAGFRVVVTLHDFFSSCPNGNLYNFVTERPCALAPMSMKCVVTDCDKRRYSDKLYRVARSALQRWPGRMPGGLEHFIGLSRRSVELMRPYLPPRAQIHSLENIIDLVRGPPVEVGKGGALVCVGRLDPEKGILLLLEAANRAGESIVFVGDGPLRTAVEASGRHRVTGWGSAHQVQSELDTARCLLFPSQWYETYGLVVSEASARGVPSIVSDVSAPAERIRDGITGFVFPSGDVAALARCLKLTADHAELAKLGRNAYDAYWSAPPDRKNHVLQLMKIYDHILLDAGLRARSSS